MLLNILLFIGLMQAGAVSQTTTELAITNVTANSTRSYQLAPDDLGNGDMGYTDRTFQYFSLTEYLIGVRYIKTPNDDKFTTGDNLLSFDVNQTVTVYVMHDNQYTTRPVWLQSFTDTGDDVGVVGSSLFSVFEKSFPAGTITLGGNAHPDNVGGYSMYTVAIVGTGAGGTDPHIWHPSRVISWQCDQEPIDMRGINGFWLHTETEEALCSAQCNPVTDRMTCWRECLAEVSQHIKCWIYTTEECNEQFPDVCWSTEHYVCPGIHVKIPPQRYLDFPAGTNVKLWVRTDGVACADPAIPFTPLDVIWPNMCEGTTNLDFKNCCLAIGGC